MNTSPVVAKNIEFLTDIRTQTWVHGRHVVDCVKVIRETDDVKTFCFMAQQPLMFFFKPGQFVTLELEIDGKQVMRSYTISSSPSVPYSFSITVKRALGGVVSNWLHDDINEGDTIAVHGPVGNFNCIDFPDPKVLFLSGGVGITPVMSMARWFFDTNADVDMNFVHSARTPADIIFRTELELMSARIKNFHLNFIVEKDEIGQPWGGYRGYLDQNKIDMIAPDFMEREIFCCGPKPYMDAVKRLLIANHFDMDKYHEESFGETPEAAQEISEDQAKAAAEQDELINSEDLLQVTFSGTGKSIAITVDETIHTAASKLGMHIPKACGMGICGTCKVKKVSGDTVGDHNGGITEEDIADGYILSCCNTPTTDVVIDF